MLQNFPAVELNVRFAPIRLLPARFETEPLISSGLPEMKKPPLLNVSHGAVMSTRSLTFACRVTPSKIKAVPPTGAVPAQLPPVLQLSSAPPPVHVSVGIGGA